GLRALRIITDDTPDPIPLEGRPGYELSAEEMRELLRRMRRREADDATVKEEEGVMNSINRECTSGDGQDDDDEVKFIETRSQKRPRVDPEVILLD
ncbi:hypothetical protein EJ02DRAFT_423642, partial [Clathrospora elynae]